MSVSRSYTVGVFGVPDFELQVLCRIFALSASRPRTYALTEENAATAPDVVLVDEINPAALARWRAARWPGRAPVPVMVLTGESTSDATYQLRRPLIATRVLGVLDQVAMREVDANRTGSAEQAPSDGPAGGAGSPTPGATPGSLAAAPRISPPPEQAAPCPESRDTVHDDHRYLALVVDDSLAVRKQVGLALRRVNIDADLAESGEAALRLIEEKSYDVIFLDVVMPGLDGYEVCKSVKRNRARKNTPVIMLTGRSSPFDRVRGKLSGCDTYLTKPVRFDDFRKTLDKHLKQPIAFAPDAAPAQSMSR